MKFTLVAVCAWFVVVGPVSGNPLNGATAKIDYCAFGLNDTSNGRAYTIESLADAKLGFTQSFFEKHLKTVYMTEKFTSEFSDNYLSVLDNLEWYYSFETVRRINVANILPSSLPCIYVTDRSSDFQIFLNYTSPQLASPFINSFLLVKTLHHLMTEVPSHVPIPLIDLAESDVSWETAQLILCNYAKSTYIRNNYYLAICFDVQYTDTAFLTVSIMKQNSTNWVMGNQILEDISDIIS